MTEILTFHCVVCGTRFFWPEPTPPYCFPHLWERPQILKQAAAAAHEAAMRRLSR